jgi:hypothetical protein
MSVDNWYDFFLKEYEDKIIETWLNGIDREYIGLYNLSDMHQNGTVYFELLKDIHTPTEQHPQFETIPQMYRYHAENETPVEHLQHSLLCGVNLYWISFGHTARMNELLYMK